MALVLTPDPGNHPASRTFRSSWMIVLGLNSSRIALHLGIALLLICSPANRLAMANHSHRHRVFSYFIGGLHGWFIEPARCRSKSSPIFPSSSFFPSSSPSCLQSIGAAEIVRQASCSFPSFCSACTSTLTGRTCRCSSSFRPGERLHFSGLNLINHYPVGPFAVSLNSVSGNLVRHLAGHHHAAALDHHEPPPGAA